MTDCFYNYVLQKVQPDVFEGMVNDPNHLQNLLYDNFIAGYNPNDKGDSLRTSGGLKSDEEEKILGSFVVFQIKLFIILMVFFS